MPKKRTSPNPVNVGRPSAYSDDYCSLIRVLRSQGHGISGFCSYVGISEKTYYNWQKEHPEFAEACDIALMDSDAHFNQLMLDGGTGKIEKFNQQAINTVYNRQHGVVKDDTAKTQINIGNMNVLQSLPQAELDAQIAHKLKLLGQVKVIDDGSATDNE